MKVLVLNCGSSSLKYQLLDMKSADDYELKAKGLVERIGMDMSVLTHRKTGADKFVIEKPIADHKVAISCVFKELLDEGHGVISSVQEIEAVGHRVAHGGEYFTESAFVDKEAERNIEACCDLAPLHNPANLLGIRAMSELLPDVPQVAVFDTSFHSSMPDYAYLYAIPYEYYEKYGVRRYGFHGTSHKFVAEKACKILGKDIDKMKIITCHLGNGSSITAIQNGKSIDTSMGFTPLEGLIMGTRSGNIDPGAVSFIEEKEGITPSEMNTILNKKSGFLGLSGISSDCRDLTDAADAGSERAKLTLKKLAYDILKYIGAYSAVMDGVDLVVFTGGIGENNRSMRRMVCEHLDFLGVEFDYEANDSVSGEDVILTKPGAKTVVMALTTNEELVIARDTLRIVGERMRS
ncbi:acetate kinase [Muribaculum sp. An289]|jgi:acetate kinase|uniref:acetate/propionate family kinase n=1 Tax=unclassified Muribaculum TaxID=2622126 RepID=UPI000B3A8B75|nr:MULTISPECIES: acetate kinase [unclassified Muribaculum]OUO37823.1 acetate kinase [Muribaculum sp. An289]OUO43638.1 acetate kinase [Muribaculum sp. An287]